MTIGFLTETIFEIYQCRYIQWGFQTDVAHFTLSANNIPADRQDNQSAESVSLKTMIIYANF